MGYRLGSDGSDRPNKYNAQQYDQIEFKKGQVVTCRAQAIHTKNPPKGVGHDHLVVWREKEGFIHAEFESFEYAQRALHTCKKGRFARKKILKQPGIVGKIHTSAHLDPWMFAPGFVS